MEGKTIVIGDKVAYSREFLRSTGEYTGSIPFARGIVSKLLAIGPEITLATVEWNTPEAPERVNVKNLVKVDRMHLEPV